jgi:surface carbohydrate biosynthesis protein (TIGR04326 family)
VAATASGRHIVPLQRFIRLRDAVRLLSPARFLKLLRVQRALREPLAIGFGTFDISKLVASEILTSISDAELFFDQLLESGLTRYAAGMRPAALVYRVEGQPWENALLAAARRTGTFVTGFFHSPFGERYPALRFAPGEIGGAGHGAGRRALPDGMLVCGRTVRRYLEADGYPASRIVECGPQRHADFVRFLRERPTRAELRARLGLPQRVRVHYVALAIVEAETEGLFACLERALADSDDFRLLIKTHPNRPQADPSTEAALRVLGARRTSLVPAGASMYEYLAASDTMICIGSTVAFEAMALGVMPVVYEHPGTFAVTSLRAFEQSLYVVNSPATMGRALAEIDGDSRGVVERRGRFAATVAGVFGDLETALEQQLSRAVVELAAGSQLRANAH